jgi:carboxyl-terminal processing protease
VAGAIQDQGRGLIVGETSFGKGLVQRVFQLPYNNGLTLTTARYYTPYGRSLQRDYSGGSLYDYYTRHDADDVTPPANSKNEQPPVALASPTPHAPTGPAVKTAAGRVFYGGGGITPDIEVRLPAGSIVRNRIVDETFYFTRLLVAGAIPGLETYRVDKVQHGRDPKPSDLPVTDRVIEAFREFVKADSQAHLTAAQLDAELDYVKLRLREEILSAAYGADNGARVLLDSDPQVLRAIEALPDAKRLAESVRNGTSQG